MPNFWEWSQYRLHAGIDYLENPKTSLGQNQEDMNLVLHRGAHLSCRVEFSFYYSVRGHDLGNIGMLYTVGNLRIQAFH